MVGTKHHSTTYIQHDIMLVVIKELNTMFVQVGGSLPKKSLEPVTQGYRYYYDDLSVLKYCNFLLYVRTCFIELKIESLAITTQTHRLITRHHVRIVITSQWFFTMFSHENGCTLFIIIIIINNFSSVYIFSLYTLRSATFALVWKPCRASMISCLWWDDIVCILSISFSIGLQFFSKNVLWVDMKKTGRIVTIISRKQEQFFFCLTANEW